jgi:hypothetical protein
MKLSAWDGKEKGTLRSSTKQVPERKRILQSIHCIQRSLVGALDLRLISAVRSISILAIAVTVPSDQGITAGRRRLVLARTKEPSLQRDRHISDQSMRANETVRNQDQIKCVYCDSVGESERGEMGYKVGIKRAFLGRAL